MPVHVQYKLYLIIQYRWKENFDIRHLKISNCLSMFKLKHLRWRCQLVLERWQQRSVRWNRWRARPGEQTFYQQLEECGKAKKLDWFGRLSENRPLSKRESCEPPDWNTARPTLFMCGSSLAMASRHWRSTTRRYPKCIWDCSIYFDDFLEIPDIPELLSILFHCSQRCHRPSEVSISKLNWASPWTLGRTSSVESPSQNYRTTMKLRPRTEHTLTQLQSIGVSMCQCASLW